MSDKLGEQCNAVDIDNCAEHGWWTRFKCQRTCDPSDYAWDLPHYKDCTVWEAKR